VERYHFFGASIRTWQPTARGLIERRADESAGGGMLATCLRVLREVHAEFFAGAEGSSGGGGGGGGGGVGPANGSGGSLRAPTKRRRLREGEGGASGRSGSEGPGGGGGTRVGGAPTAAVAPPPLDPDALRGRDVRACLADARARVLRGCCVCFSRCWPQHLSSFEQPLWVMAEGLGADCSTRYAPGRTTHVVAAPDRSGELPLTDKVQAARRDSVAVVHYDWVVASKFRCGARGAAGSARGRGEGRKGVSAGPA
jgi:hypothetical protein